MQAYYTWSLFFNYIIYIQYDCNLGVYLEPVCTLLGSSPGVEVLVEVGLHGRNVGLHAALVVRDGSDVDGQFVNADSGVVELVLGVLAGTLSLENKIGIRNLAS